MQKVSSQRDQEINTLSHRLDMLILFTLYISIMACLIRSDFNFLVIFFCYFLKQQRWDQLTAKIIIAGIILVSIFDLIFAFAQIRVWLTTDQNNPIWQTIRPMHNFGIFCFSLIMILKIVLLIFLFKSKSLFQSK